VVGSGTAYERDFFSINTVKPQLAPSGYNVLDGAKQKANIWRCFDQSSRGKACHSVGQAAYGLTWGKINATDAGFGLNVTYGPGYGEWTAQLRFHCDPELAPGHVWFRDVGGLSDRTVELGAYTAMVCAGYDDGFRILKGGAVFVMIILVGTVLYITGGVAVEYLRSGLVKFPNEEFWAALGDSIKTTVTFIVSCGKTVNVERSDYENVPKQ
jgi:hypothetical protein